MSDLLTPRAYLVTLGLAKDGRGKFSAAGHAALDAAKASGMTFAEIVKPVAKPRVAKVAKPISLAKADVPAKPTPAVMPKRILGDLARPVPRNLPVFRKQETLYAKTPEGYTVGYDRCYSQACMLPVANCACKNGPQPVRGATAILGYSRV